MSAKWLAVPVACAAILGYVAPANAAVITQCGTNLCFTYDDSTLYGSGTVIDNNIFFLTTDFQAESLNGEGLVTVSDTLSIGITVQTPGYVLTGVALAEQGDYLLNGAGASVDVSGTLDLMSNTSVYSDSVAYSGGALTNQGSLSGWSLNESIILSDTAGWYFDSDVTLDIYNILSADTSANGEQAFIEKKLEALAVGIEFEVNVIPIPAAAWLFGSGLVMLGGLSRRKARLQA